MSRIFATLSARQITELLCKNEVSVARNVLPAYIKSLECNQLASNSPIEDRLRVSLVKLPETTEPTLIMGVFDGHGGGTTADLISRRLFNYIALSLHPDPRQLKISHYDELKNLVVDLHNSPMPREDAVPRNFGLKSLVQYKDQLTYTDNVAENLKNSFRRCDEDLSGEIQTHLKSHLSNQAILHYYLSAAVSGCCALVVVLHKGIAYVASSGDCRAVLGTRNQKSFDASKTTTTNLIQDETKPKYTFSALELNDEHNCDNVSEIRRLASSHPKKEQNTIVRSNRLLGYLMPFRAFGDFNYKWSAETIRACGITRAFGSGAIPPHYETPPYLIVEPDVKSVRLDERSQNETILDDNDNKSPERYLVVATDGLWELFESSREVVESIVNHSLRELGPEEEYDENCATHLLRSALQSGPQQDFGSDTEELKRMYHVRLESLLTLPQAVVRNFRDDISILLLKL